MDRRLAVVGLVLMLAGCRGKLVATADLKGPGTATTRFAWSGKPVAIWADTDAVWNGPKNSKPEINYEVDVSQNGKNVGHVSCSTNDRGATSVCGSTTNVMGKHDGDCEMILTCTLPPLQLGEVEVKVVGTTGANVRSTKKMSLNFRHD